MQELDIDLAKKRIWKRLEAKLPDRPAAPFPSVVQALRASEGEVKMSYLRKVQSKERLLDLLPERGSTSFALPTRLVSLGTLGLFLGVLFVPLMDLTPTASAASQNTLELVDGAVFVNGVQVTELTILQVGDSVTTGDGAMAHLTFVDDSRVTMGPSSQVTLTEAWMDSKNRANSRVELWHDSGRVWVQVLNLVTETSSFTVAFPDGKVWVDERASFDIQQEDEGVQIGVARNLVELEVTASDQNYEGVLGQGAQLVVHEDIQTQVIPDEERENVWWTFNLAYGKSYARSLDESYKQENFERALILPGNPLYGLKTFRENLQVSLVFTSKAKKELLIEQAESRLNEAQVLLAKGDLETAARTMSLYEETVGELEGAESTETVTALEEEVKKETLTSKGSGSLQLVPDLIAEGEYEEALLVLEAYKANSLAELSKLTELSMEERKAAVSKLLDQKLKDLQLLKVIAGNPEFSEALDFDSSVMKELSLMALSLREKELDDLSVYLELFEEDELAQEELYTHLMEETEMEVELSDQFEEIQEKISDPFTESVVIDIEPIEAVEPESLDPRFSVPHADQSED